MNPGDPLIFDIARASFVNGPGVRTTVFFKGCPLSCPWCHNPESQAYGVQEMFFRENCIRCGNCEKKLPCFSLARKTVGESISPDRLIRMILEDKAYYIASRGGVTFSGGEPLSFIEYLSEVIPALKKEGIHVAVQTCGYFNFAQFALHLLPHIDMVYFDLKIMDNDIHQRLLGKSNQLILENFRKLVQSSACVIPRIPLVPHFVATSKNLDEIARFLAKQDVSGCEFVYYHTGSQGKWLRLNQKPSAELPEKPLSMAENQGWIAYFKNRIQSERLNRSPHVFTATKRLEPTSLCSAVHA